MAVTKDKRPNPLETYRMRDALMTLAAGAAFGLLMITGLQSLESQTFQHSGTQTMERVR